MFWIDDRDGFVYDELSPLPLNGKNPYYIWPGFGNSDGGVDEKSYDGWVYIGETKAAEFVKTALSGKEILSQLSINQGIRAQFLGNDTDHWGYVYRWNHGVLEYNPLLMEEPLNDMGTAVEEGTGYFFTNLYNERERRELLKFLSVDTARYLVGKESPLAKSSDWIEKLPKIERSEFNESAWKFEWTTLPPDKILYAGSTTAGLYTFFWKYSKNKSLALELITAASHKMWNDYEHRNLFYAVTHLAMELERYADTPLGELDMKSGQITSSMVPYALLDLMTRFGLDKNRMDQWIQALPKEQRPLAFDAYWGKYHSQIFGQVGHVTYSRPMPLEESVSDIFQFFDKKEMILSQPYSPTVMGPSRSFFGEANKNYCHAELDSGISIVSWQSQILNTSGMLFGRC